MSNIKEKARENMVSADLLIKNDYRTASVHCLYYSCFQLSKYILKTYYDLDYSTQAKEIEEQKGNSHNYIIEKLFNFVNQDKGRLAAVDCKKHLKNLKLGRKKADYSDEKMSQNEIDDLKSAADSFNNICEINFNETL